MRDEMEKRWTALNAVDLETENLEVFRYRNEVWITGWDIHERGHVFMFTADQARDIAAHLIACADTAEKEAPDDRA